MTTSDKTMIATGKLFAALIQFAISIIPIIIKGYVLSILWGWFIVPKFGAPPLGVAWAIGVSAILAVALPRPQAMKTLESDNWGLSMFVSTFYPLFGLLVGWIAHLFI